MKRSAVLHVTGFLWRFQWFRCLCVCALGLGVAHRAIGLYTPFWAAGRLAFSRDGAHQDLSLARRAGEQERHYERLARVAQL